MLDGLFSSPWLVAVVGGLIVFLLCLGGSWFLKRWLKARRLKKEIRSNFRAIRAECVSRREHPVAALVVSNWLKSSLAHLISSGDIREYVSLQEYKNMLDVSLKWCTKRCLATSLLSPKDLLDREGELRDQFIDYLESQKERKFKEPSIDMMRIFIMNEDRFCEGNYGEEMKNLHRGARVTLAICNLEDLERKNPQFIEDFVLFEDQKGKWIISGGRKLSPELEQAVSVKVIDSQMQISSHYQDFMNTIEELDGANKIIWFRPGEKIG